MLPAIQDGLEELAGKNVVLLTWGSLLIARLERSEAESFVRLLHERQETADTGLVYVCR